MKKMNYMFVALASAMLATSCSTDDIQSGGKTSNSKIDVHPTIGNVTRATETTTANLQSFKTFSFLSGDDKNYMEGVTYNNNGGDWTTNQGDFYWPVDGDLNFYSYAPETPGESGEVTITPTAQKLTGFTPYSTAATQQDFIYSKAKGNLADNGKNGIDFNFSHALSEITVAAKNDNKAYTVDVTGVKIGNSISKGDFTFPSLDGGDASWTLGTDKSDYITEWETANTLGTTVSSFDEANTAFMLIPQQLSSKKIAKEGNYIALKIKLTMQGGKVMYEGWSYVGIPTLWEMNKHYHYTLDYTNGAGQDENGDPIIPSSGAIKFNVTVTPWDEESQTLLRNYAIGKSNSSEEFYIGIEEEKYAVKPYSDGTWKQDITNATSLGHMFDDCTNLVNISMPNLDVRRYSTFICMFRNCSSLTTLDLSGWKTDKIDELGWMFQNCSSLTSLDLSGWNFIETIGCGNSVQLWGIFDGCTNLRTLDLSGWNLHQATLFMDVFKGCTSLKAIYMVGCDEATIEKIKSCLSSAGLSTDIIKTTKD